jgi:hypothetical protein
MKKEGRDNNMPDHKEIYNRHANQYELLVSREDYQHNIPGRLAKSGRWMGWMWLSKESHYS